MGMCPRGAVPAGLVLRCDGHAVPPDERAHLHVISCRRKIVELQWLSCGSTATLPPDANSPPPATR
eukprot:4741233-Alexandrium_andersonii.AAC.1